MSYEVRVLSSDEKIQANSLYEKVYGKKRDIVHFKWEFQDGPEGSAVYVGAFDGIKLVGSQAAIPLSFIDSAGQLKLTAKSEDTLLDPAYRGKGLFEEMYKVLFVECKRLGMHSIWGFTYAKKPFLKIGFQIPFDTTNGVCVVQPIKAFTYLSSLNPKNGRKEKLQIATLSFVSYFKRLIILIGPDNHKFEFGDFSSHPELIKDILGKTNYYFLNQSDEYLKWRLIENPYLNSYKEIVVRNEKNNVIGSFIINIRKEGFAYVEQILFAESCGEELKMVLMKQFLRFVSNQSGVSLIRFWGFDMNEINRNEINILKKSGFLFVKKGTGFVYFPLLKESPNADQIILSRLYTQGNI